MKVKDLLARRSSPIVSVQPEDTVKEAIARMVENNIGSVLVCTGSQELVGILTERDVLRLAHEDPGGFVDKKVESVMTRNPIIARADDDLTYVGSVMAQYCIRHLPILDGEKLAGILSIRDVICAERDDAVVEKRYLMDYITRKYPA